MDSITGSTLGQAFANHEISTHVRQGFRWFFFGMEARGRLEEGRYVLAHR
jgi:hypothetical protein